LSQLRLFLLRASEGFTEFYYVGSEPLDGGMQHVDVLVTVLAGAESRWYFDKENGDLVGFDTRLVEDADACELRFREFGDFGGRLMPSRILVRHAEQEFATFLVQRVELRSEGARGNSPGKESE
jgi:hypothetical protein